MDASVRDGKVYEFGRFRLDPARRALTLDGARVALSPTVLETLLYFVEHPGRVVTKDELMDAIWPRKLVEESNISQTIFTLRKALAAAGDPDPVIVTHPGRGYRFAAPVTIRTSHERAFIPAPSPAAAPPKRRLWMIAASAIAILIGAALLLTRPLWQPRSAPARQLVVLGEFRNLTGEPLLEQTFAEATRTEMRQSPYLTVLSARRLQDTLALMTRPATAQPSEADLQEVCARNSGLAVINGVLARVGAHYLVTIGADDCTSGESLSTEQTEVAGRDNLLPALDDLTKSLRQKLGESAESVSAASIPLVKARTPSFEALQAFSQAHYDVEHGARTDAIPLYRHAIALDPNFAAAYAELANTLYNLKQLPEAAAAITRARQLMAGVDPRERLAIESAYNAFVDHDADVGLQIERTITEVYPNDADAWANLANEETWLGHPLASIDPGRRAVALEPNAEAAYVVLARAYLHAGRFADALATCRLAIARKVDGEDLHTVVYDLAIAQGDTQAAARQVDDARGKPGERWILLDAGQAAFRAGQVRHGLDVFAEAVAMGKSFGGSDFTAAPNARLLYDMGLTDRARTTLAQVPAGFDSQDYRFSLAEFGDAAAAQRLLSADLAKAPRDTLLNHIFAPEVHAALALRAGNPQGAVQALAPAAPYEMHTYDIPYLRGLAYLAGGDGAAAAHEFHKVLDHPGVEAVSVHYPLSHLGLARAEALRGDRAQAMAAYQAFFTDWKAADPDMPLLQAAKVEYARLAQGSKRHA